MSLQDFTKKIGAKLITPERITSIVDKILQDTIGYDLHEKVFRIERAQEGGPAGYKDTDNIVVRSFFIHQGNRQTTESIEQIIERVKSQVPTIPGIDIEKYTTQVLEIARSYFDTSQKYTLIGRDRVSGRVELLNVRIIMVESGNEVTGEAEILPCHDPGESFFLTDVLPGVVRAAIDGGYTDFLTQD